MRKITSKLLLTMMTVIMSFSLAACGSEKDDQKGSATSGTSQITSDNSKSDDNADNSNDSNDTNDDDSTGNALYGSLSDYLNSDEVQKSIDTVKDSLKGSGMSMDVTAKDNALIYTYTYDSVEKTDELAKQLDESITAVDSTFQQIANDIKKYVGIDSASVAVKYIDCNGDEIASKEWVSE